jgi:hypothetical protein
MSILEEVTYLDNAFGFGVRSWVKERKNQRNIPSCGLSAALNLAEFSRNRIYRFGL